MRQLQLGFLAILATLLLAACATQPKPTHSPHPKPRSNDDVFFPAPYSLQPQVAFWRNVYAVWGRNKVVFYDNRHMDVIYEVITLPGPIISGYTPEQKQLLKARRKRLKNLLAQMEYKVAVGAPLSRVEQVLASRIRASSGGVRAIAGASKRLYRQRGLRERFKRGLEISGRYNAAFRQIFRKAGLPDDLAYLPHVESSFQNHAASSVGAAGMWQFMRSTARQYMTVNRAIDERLDPIIAAESAARYLGNAYSKLGSWPLAITSYNHGVGGMQRAKTAMGGDIARIVHYYSGRNFGFASRNFYTEFLAAREVARNHQRYFPEGIRFKAPLNQDRIRLRQTATADTVAAYYQVSLSSLNRINRAWRRAAKRGRVPLPAGSMVWLPAGTIDRLVRRGIAGRALALADPVATTRQRRRLR